MGIVSGGGGGGAAFNGGTITNPLVITQAGPAANVNALTVTGAGVANDGDKLAYFSSSDDAAAFALFTDGTANLAVGFDTTTFTVRKAGGAIAFQTQGGTKVGFFGAAPVVKPAVAGAKLPTDVVMASLLTALVALGLVTDNST